MAVLIKLTAVLNCNSYADQNFAKSSKTVVKSTKPGTFCSALPRFERVLPSLQSLGAVADKQNTCLGHQMPPFAANCGAVQIFDLGNSSHAQVVRALARVTTDACRVSKTLRHSEFCSLCPRDIFILAKSEQNTSKCVKSRQ